jgi:hypothetical protein
VSKKLRENRRNFLNLTITEIILIILFLLMMVSAYLVQKSSQLERELSEYKDALNQYEKEGIDKAQLVELSKLNKVIQEYKKQGKGNFSPSELAEIINEVVLSKDVVQQLKEASEELAQLKEVNKKITEARDFYKGKYEKTGNDKPPCWPRINDPLNADYLYEAVINSEGIILTNTIARYPHRTEDRAKLPLSSVLENRVIQPQQFLDQTKEIKKLSDQLECRHYISVFDQSGNDKSHWKRMIKAVESNFYIYENK